MRECIYCGRQLEKGEQCTCAMSEAKRRAKSESQGAANAEEPKKQKKKRKKQPKQKKTRTKYTYQNNIKFDRDGLFREFWRLLKAFVKSPVETVMNPGEMSRAVIFMFVLAEGIISGISIYTLITGNLRGPFSFLGNLMGLRGLTGYSAIKAWLLSAVSGAVSGLFMYFVYSGIFYVVNRWIFKQFTPYWDFVKRFAFAFLPFSLVGALGAVLGLFSQRTFLVLLICAVVGTLIITYEILRSVWYSKSESKIIYTMMACIFVFLTILIHFINFA